MAWPTFLALVQVIGCPAADADRVGALIDLELAGSATEAVEVRCGPQMTVVVKADGRTRTRTLPGETLSTDGGPRLIAVAAADLADELRRVPAKPAPVAPVSPIAPVAPIMPAAPRSTSRWQVAASLAGRTEFDGVRFGFGAVGRWIDDGRMLELSGTYYPGTQQSGGALLDTEARLAQAAFAAGFLLGADDGLQTGGVLGWSAGWGSIRGVQRPAEGGSLGIVRPKTVEGPVGGPFLGARVLFRFGRGVVGANINQGWAAWTLTGRVLGEPREQFDGIWLDVLAQIGIEL